MELNREIFPIEGREVGNIIKVGTNEFMIMSLIPTCTLEVECRRE